MPRTIASNYQQHSFKHGHLQAFTSHRERIAQWDRPLKRRCLGSAQTREGQLTGSKIDGSVNVTRIMYFLISLVLVRVISAGAMLQSGIWALTA